MESRLIVENASGASDGSSPDRSLQIALEDRLSALELQLKIYKQAEVIGEIGNWQINLNTFETWYSENTFRIYGLEPFSRRSHPDTFNSFIQEQDREIVLNAFEKSYLEKIPLHLEFRITRPDGQERHINIVSYVTKNAKGEPLLTGITQDITDRKNLELQLRDNTEKIELQNDSFRQAEQIGLFGTWQINLNTRQTQYSENYFRIFGIKPTSPSPGFEEFTKLFHPDDQGHYKDIIKKIFAGEAPPDAEFRIIRNDGRPKYVRLKCKLLKNAEGDPLIVGIIKDNTAATRLELQLKEMNQRLLLQDESFRHAEKTTNIGSWTWNIDTNKLQASDHIYTIFGLKPQSIEPGFEGWKKYIDPMDRPALERIVIEMRKQPTEIEYSYRIIRPDGKKRQLKTRCQPIVSADGRNILIGTTQDITEDVHLNQQLKERIHFAEILRENIVDKICVTNSSNIIIGWNNKSEVGFNLSREEVLGRNFFEVFPKLKTPETVARFNKVLNGELVSVRNLKIAYLAGSYELTMIPIREGNEEVTASLMILHDISEHEKLKSELEERLQFIEKLIESSSHRIMVLDRNMNFVYWNKKSEEYYGFAKEQVIDKNLSEVFPLIRKEPLFEKIKNAWKGKTVQIPINRENTSEKYSEGFLVPIKNASEQVIALLWMEHDLTELINAEKELKVSKDLLQSVFDTSMTGIAVFESVRDKEGKIIDFEIKLVNEYGMEMLGPDVIGKRQLEILPDVESGGFFELNKDVVETGIPVDTEKYYSGRKISGWFRITATKMGDGLVFGFDDISERKLAEVQLLKQRSLLLQAEELARLGSWELNPKTKLFIWSDQIFRIFDYALQTFSPTLEFYLGTIPQDERETVAAYFEAARDGEEFSIKHHLRTLDGRELHVLLKGQPLLNESKKTSVIVGTLQDITDQQNIEEELKLKSDLIRLHNQIARQSEQIHQKGSWQWDLKSGEMLWGESMFHLFHTEPFSFKPSLDSIVPFIHPDDIHKVVGLSEDLKHLSESENLLIEFRILVEDSVRNLRSTLRRVSNRIDDVYVGSTIDFTDEAVLHEMLAERMYFAEALVEASVDRIIVLDKDLKIIGWNKACENAYGNVKEKVMGKHYLEQFPNARHSPTVREALKSAVEGTRVYVPVQKALHTTGYAEAHYIPISNSRGEIHAVLNIVHDVTERISSEHELRKLNESLSQKNKELHHMNEEIASFAFIASHDLREPLRKVQVFSDRILTREAQNFSDSAKEEFQRIQNAVRRMDVLIDDILNFSSIHSSDDKFIRFDLNDVLRKVEADMSEKIIQKQVLIESPGLPEIDGNPAHFSHLFKNLLSNAIKFQPEGQQPVIRIEAHKLNGNNIDHPNAIQDAEYLRITIADNGIGFEQQYEHRIFQMFQRLYGLHEYPGTGIGLTICKKVVEVYDGFITASSSPGNGAVFSCYFKLKSQQHSAN